MTRTQLINEIIRTYDSEMAIKYGAWLKGQNKARLEEIWAARQEHIAKIIGY